MSASNKPGLPGLFDAGPSLETVVATILELEPLEATAQKLGVSRTRLVRILKSAVPETTSLETGGSTAPAPETKGKQAIRAPAQVAMPSPAAAAASSSSPAAATTKKLRLYFDGASRGNPGPAGAGAVLYDESGKVVRRAGKYLGVQTNNVAEYSSAILGLEKALEHGATDLDIRADSMLAIMQLKGEWKVKNEGIRPLHRTASELLSKFRKVHLAHVPREQNAAADEMSNRAIDERMDGSERG